MVVVTNDDIKHIVEAVSPSQTELSQLEKIGDVARKACLDPATVVPYAEKIDKILDSARTGSGGDIVPSSPVTPSSLPE